MCFAGLSNTTPSAPSAGQKIFFPFWDQITGAEKQSWCGQSATSTQRQAVTRCVLAGNLPEAGNPP